MSNSRPQMKPARKKPYYQLRIRPRSTPDLLASGVATITFINGDYTLHIDSVEDALRGDFDAIVRDAHRAYSRLDEREPA